MSYILPEFFWQQPYGLRFRKFHFVITNMASTTLPPRDIERTGSLRLTVKCGIERGY
jgi:hypothetical protein